MRTVLFNVTTDAAARPTARATRERGEMMRGAFASASFARTRARSVVVRAAWTPADELGRRGRGFVRASSGQGEDASLASAFDALASRAGRGTAHGTREPTSAGRGGGGSGKGAQTPLLGLLTTPRIRSSNRRRAGGLRALFDAL